jgi:hypothetical protein
VGQVMIALINYLAYRVGLFWASDPPDNSSFESQVGWYFPRERLADHVGGVSDVNALPYVDWYFLLRYV